MTLALILLLAALQGLTEFLPVSSSGHLRLLQSAFGVEDPQTLVDVVLHVGTLGAVLVVYRRDVGRILASLGRAARLLARGERRGLLTREPDTRVALLLLLATIPAGLIGVIFGALMEARLTAPHVVGAFLILNGTLLFLAGRSRVARGTTDGRKLHELSPFVALLIGAAQAMALLRGISRAGSTISVALLCGVDREEAARFSFLLSVPAIAGAALLELRHLTPGSGVPLMTLLAGAATAFVVGYLALRLLLRLVRRGHLGGFAWYCWVLGGTAILTYVLFGGWR
jgi:undecaprenyl-diphosphatase